MEHPTDPMFEGNDFKQDFQPCSFFAVTDPEVKKDLIASTHCKPDANNFTFWTSQTDSEFWGLTIKSQTYKGKGQKPDVNWKLTLFHKEGAIRPSQKTAEHCTAPITLEDTVQIYSKYKQLF